MAMDTALANADAVKVQPVQINDPVEELTSATLGDPAVIAEEFITVDPVVTF